MTSILISEKNKAASAIAEALGKISRINYAKGLTIYHIQTIDLYIIPLRGHISGYENTEQFASWSKSDPRDIIIHPDSIERKPSSYANVHIKALKEYGKKANLVIIGTDADVEGCNIGIMDALPYVKQVNPQIQVKQIWLNDMQKRSIQQAYQNLIVPKWSWAKAGEARAVLDAIIGFSATREVTLTLAPILRAIKTKMASIGRVQSSLLYLIYLREKEIRDFKPEPYWTIDAKIQFSNTEIMASHEKSPFRDEKIAVAIYNKVKNARIAKLIKNESEIKKIHPPTPLNTSDALILITNNLHISAEHALSTLENLYLNKLISYPRTDSDKYKDSFNHVEILKTGTNHQEYGSFINGVIQKGKKAPRNGKVDAEDHTPITPTEFVPLNSPKLSNDLERKTYDLICRHYLAGFGESAEEVHQTLTFLIEQELFISKITALIQPGFLEIAPFLSKKYSLVLTPEMDQFRVLQINYANKFTEPPPRYNDTSLIKLMEQHNIGTKSTRPSVIELLISRNYVERKNRAIYLLELGYLLMDNLKDIWLSFLEPKFTAKVEEILEEVKSGKKQMDDAIDEVRIYFLDLFDKFRAVKPTFLAKMNSITQTGNVKRGRNNEIINSKKKDEPQKTTANCPFCKRVPMIFVKTKDNKRFFVCSDEKCKNYLSVPKEGKITLLKITCKICNFNAIKVTRKFGNTKSEYYLCPNCWREGLQNKNDKGFCSKCTEYQISKGKCIKKT